MAGSGVWGTVLLFILYIVPNAHTQEDQPGCQLVIEASPVTHVPPRTQIDIVVSITVLGGGQCSVTDTTWQCAKQTGQCSPSAQTDRQLTLPPEEVTHGDEFTVQFCANTVFCKTWQINAALPDLVAIITPRPTHVHYQSTVSIQGDLSYDPASEDTGQYTFEWSACLWDTFTRQCGSRTNEITPLSNVPSTQHSSIQIDISELQIGNSVWKFTLTYSHTTTARSSSDSVLINFVVSYLPPQAVLGHFPIERINPSEGLQLRAIVTEGANQVPPPGKYTLTWRVNEIDITQEGVLDTVQLGSGSFERDGKGPTLSFARGALSHLDHITVTFDVTSTESNRLVQRLGPFRVLVNQGPRYEAPPELISNQQQKRTPLLISPLTGKALTFVDVTFSKAGIIESDQPLHYRVVVSPETDAVEIPQTSSLTAAEDALWAKLDRPGPIHDVYKQKVQLPALPPLENINVQRVSPILYVRDATGVETKFVGEDVVVTDVEIEFWDANRLVNQLTALLANPSTASLQRLVEASFILASSYAPIRPRDTPRFIDPLAATVVTRLTDSPPTESAGVKTYLSLCRFIFSTVITLLEDDNSGSPSVSLLSNTALLVDHLTSNIDLYRKYDGSATLITLRGTTALLMAYGDGTRATSDTEVAEERIDGALSTVDAIASVNLRNLVAGELSVSGGCASIVQSSCDLLLRTFRASAGFVEQEVAGSGLPVGVSSEVTEQTLNALLAKGGTTSDVDLGIAVSTIKLYPFASFSTSTLRPLSAVYRVHVYGLSASSNEITKIDISNLNEGKEFQLSVPMESENTICAYWNAVNKTWSTDGLTTEKQVSNVLCKTTHLTDIAVFNERNFLQEQRGPSPPQSPTVWFPTPPEEEIWWPTWLFIGVAALVGAGLLLLFCVLIWYYCCGGKERRRVEQDPDILALQDRIEEQKLAPESVAVVPPPADKELQVLDLERESVDKQHAEVEQEKEPTTETPGNWLSVVPDDEKLSPTRVVIDTPMYDNPLIAPSKQATHTEEEVKDLVLKMAETKLKAVQPKLGLQVGGTNVGRVVVLTIRPNGPVAHTQIQEGDHIVALGDTLFLTGSVRDFSLALAAMQPGDNSTLTVYHPQTAETHIYPVRIGSQIPPYDYRLLQHIVSSQRVNLPDDKEGVLAIDISSPNVYPWY